MMKQAFEAVEFKMNIVELDPKLSIKLNQTITAEGMDPILLPTNLKFLNRHKI